MQKGKHDLLMRASEGQSVWTGREGLEGQKGLLRDAISKGSPWG